MSAGKIINPCAHRILSCISHVRPWAGQQPTETEYSNETKQNAHFLTSLLRNAFVFLLLSESPIANIDKSFLFSASGTPLLNTQSEHPTAFHYSAPATRSKSPKYGGWWEMDVLSFRFCFAGYSNRFCILHFAFGLPRFPKDVEKTAEKSFGQIALEWLAVQKVRASSLVHTTMPHSMTNALSVLVALVAAEITLLSNLNSKKKQLAHSLCDCVSIVLCQK